MIRDKHQALLMLDRELGRREVDWANQEGSIVGDFTWAEWEPGRRIVQQKQRQATMGCFGVTPGR